MLENIKNKNVIFTGSFSLFIRGLVNSYNDIDIVVISENEIDGITWYDSNSIYAKKQRQGFLKLDSGKIIDAFLEDAFPEFEEIDGYKLKGLEEIKRDFLELLNSNIRSHWKKDIESKLKLLQ